MEQSNLIGQTDEMEFRQVTTKAMERAGRRMGTIWLLAGEIGGWDSWLERKSSRTGLNSILIAILGMSGGTEQHGNFGADIEGDRLETRQAQAQLRERTNSQRGKRMRYEENGGTLRYSVTRWVILANTEEFNPLRRVRTQRRPQWCGTLYRYNRQSRAPGAL